MVFPIFDSYDGHLTTCELIEYKNKQTNKQTKIIFCWLGMFSFPYVTLISFSRDKAINKLSYL